MSKAKQVVTYSNKHGRTYQAEQHEVFDRLNNRSIYQITNLRMLRKLTPHARRIIDVGAHVGTSTMEYATWAQQVDSFECDTHTFKLLEANIRRNRTSQGEPWYESASTLITARIQLHKTALMDRCATGFVTHKAEGLASYVRYDRGEQKTTTTTIDSFRWSNVDAIKLDTEGTEWLVVQGADSTIRRCRPVVQVEMWGWERRFGLDNQAMLDYFRALNYTQIDSHGRPMPWDHAGKFTKAMGQGISAMDRFFVPN